MKEEVFFTIKPDEKEEKECSEKKIQSLEKVDFVSFEEKEIQVDIKEPLQSLRGFDVNHVDIVLFEKKMRTIMTFIDEKIAKIDINLTENSHNFQNNFNLIEIKHKLNEFKNHFMTIFAYVVQVSSNMDVLAYRLNESFQRSLQIFETSVLNIGNLIN